MSGRLSDVPVPRPSSAPLPASIVDEQVAQLLRGAISMRAFLAPVLLFVVALVAWVDPTLWRRVALLALVASGIVISALSEWRVRRLGIAHAMVPANLIGTALLQLLVIALTGGVDSPLLPITIPYAILVSLTLGRRPITGVVVGLQVATVLGLTALQSMGWAEVLDAPALFVASPGRRVVVGLVVVAIVGLGSLMGLAVRRRFEGMVAEAAQAREEQLDTWIAWSRDLETLGGEIAHELKNPLASVKGLAALVGRDLPEGRSEERMAVLQGEVERMQGILDEFLTFSRPLSPLSVADVHPVELAERVVALHEGTARTALVSLRAVGEARATRGDGRKILQVLVNLVQNALVASEPGGEVVVSVGDEGGTVVFEVRDRGAGLDPDVAERAFHPGVTSRTDGSGLGLTIALAIARQHDGDLSLVDREGGGAVARLVLP